MTTKTKNAAKVKVNVFDYKSIRTFEDACKKLGIDPNQLPEVPLDEFRKPTVAAYKLMIIYAAINNGWKPDWSNYDQLKYYPWFEILSSGFGFSGADFNYAYSLSDVGSRLCTDTREKALYIAAQFEAEYRDYFLFEENK
jgi:hypothetical protein